MTDRSAFRRAMGRVSVGVLLCCGIASVRACDSPSRVSLRSRRSGCVASRRDRVRAMHAARDTVARLRARAQHVTGVASVPGGVDVRTEDVDSLALHDGGLVSVDCVGRVTMVWLDGG